MILSLRINCWVAVSSPGAKLTNALLAHVIIALVALCFSDSTMTIHIKRWNANATKRLSKIFASFLKAHIIYPRFLFLIALRYPFPPSTLNSSSATSPRISSSVVDERNNYQHIRQRYNYSNVLNYAKHSRHFRGRPIIAKGFYVGKTSSRPFNHSRYGTREKEN